MIRRKLVRHCLSGLGSVDSVCPIMIERNRAMAKTCDGEAPSEILFGFLVQAIQERETAKGKRAKGRAEGQIASLSYAVALIRNPYEVNMEAVLAEAEVEASG